jgi:flagellar biosynthetic protein FliR
MTLVIPELAAAFMLTFARVGTLVMLLPGIGEQMIPPRLRLAFALLLTLVLFPLTRTLLPASPNPQAVLLLLAGELVLGLATRMVIAALQTAGNIVAQQLGLAFAMTVDPSMGGQQAAIGNFLMLLGLTLIFSFDLHHLALMAIRDSYSYLPPNGFPGTGDAATLAIKAVGKGFALAVRGAVHRLRHPVQPWARRAFAADAAAPGLLSRHARRDPDRDGGAGRGHRRDDDRLPVEPRRFPA